MPSTRKEKERWSVLDGDLSRRRRSARVVIDHVLDRLVDIFDFPLEPNAVSSLSAPSPTPRKLTASTTGDTYTTMDGSCSPCSNNSESSVNEKRQVSMADRLRELWLSSICTGSSKTTTRRSVAICNDSVASNYAPTKELRDPWLPPTSTITPKASGGDPWLECDEQDRVLECGYQCLADEASI